MVTPKDSILFTGAPQEGKGRVLEGVGFLGWQRKRQIEIFSRAGQGPREESRGSGLFGSLCNLALVHLQV